ncbi:MAG: peptidoglycan recognition family protein [Tepidisphaeraceae bacterium]
MARSSSVIDSLKRLSLIAAVLMGLASVGCATNAPGPTASAKTAAAPRMTPDYTPAGQIRPSDMNYAPAPLPEAPRAAAKPAKKNALAGDWTPPVAPRQWRYIVIHHSASDTGSAAVFDREHKEKGWDELGYHFVIGNGTKSADGQIEVGPRWTKQKYGAHAKTPDERYNNFGVGICLVGNFDASKPTAKQTEALAKLVAWLMEEYDIPPSRVIGHGDTKPTHCPGKLMNVAAIRTRAVKLIADAGGVVPTESVAAAGTELIQSR